MCKGTNTVEKCSVVAASWMPDGKGGWMPTPEILTEDEAIRFLRIDGLNIQHPKETLRYYRSKHGLKACQIGKGVRFTIGNLRELVNNLIEKNPR